MVALSSVLLLAASKACAKITAGVKPAMTFSMEIVLPRLSRVYSMVLLGSEILTSSLAALCSLVISLAVVPLVALLILMGVALIVIET